MMVLLARNLGCCYYNTARRVYSRAVASPEPARYHLEIGIRTRRSRRMLLCLLHYLETCLRDRYKAKTLPPIIFSAQSIKYYY